MSDDLKRLAAQLHRPLKNLLALAPQNDPYNAAQPSRTAAAHWFADLWHTLLGEQSSLHDRRIHYRLVSQEQPITLPDGTAYENTKACWNYLCEAVRDARYHGLIPLDAIIDRRNPQPLLFLDDAEAEDAGIETSDGGLASGTTEIEHATLLLPRIRIAAPVVPQRYHVEIWTEKSTILDVLEPLGQRYFLNVIPYTGESSATGCADLVERVRASGKPCRILYVSDFDPGGQSMPVAAARKIEFFGRDAGLDIQVRDVALTHDQCVASRLPRTPIKENEKRAARFEQRYGEGGTELDALEALHPGELARILEDEIGRYYDRGLQRRIDRVTHEAQREASLVNIEVQRQHQSEIEALEADVAALNAEVDEFVARLREHEQEIAERAQPLFDRMMSELEDGMPDVDAFDWPEPEAGDEDDDPLFDSARDYVDQIDRYRWQQGKPEQAAYPTATCAVCNTPFTQRHPHARYCSKACANKARTDRVK